ncbi:hypothetical protein ACP70R_024141 [Stipagrostis hirtigluma subsp. patula]
MAAPPDDAGNRATAMVGDDAATGHKDHEAAMHEHDTVSEHVLAAAADGHEDNTTTVHIVPAVVDDGADGEETTQEVDDKVGQNFDGSSSWNGNL